MSSHFAVVDCSLLISFSSNLGHSADPVEIEDLARFLQKVIPPEDDGQASAGL